MADIDKDVVEALKIGLGVEIDASNMKALDIIKSSLEAISRLEEDINILKQSNLEGAEEEIELRQKYLDVLKATFKEEKKLTEEEEKRQKIQEKIQGFKDDMKQAGMSKISSAFNSIATGILKELKQILSDSLERLDKIVNSSFLTNTTTRKNAFTYGMSASQSYGFEQAKTMLGISDEDLMYMTKGQTEQFQRVMTKYAEKYDQLYDQGFFEKELEFQIMRQEFQQDIELQVAQIIMDNKDTIMSAMNAILGIFRFVESIASKVNVSTSSVSDIINNSTNNKRVSVDTTFNIQGEVGSNTINKIGQLNTSYLKSAIDNI